jgi:penicillin-binding protein 3
MVMKKSTQAQKFRIQQKSDDYIKQFKPRLNVFIAIILFLFTIIWLNLFSIQIIRNNEYSTKLINFTKTYQYIASPRGEIMDRNGEILVTNQERLAIIYYPPLNITSSEEWDLAYQFANDFDVDISTLNQRDLKDIYMINYPDEVKALISDSEWDDYYDNKITDDGIYQLKIQRITVSDTSKLTESQIKAYQVKQAMNQTPRFSQKIIKDNATVDEVAYLIANTKLYKGFDVFVYFDRSYPYDSLLKGLLGTVTSSKQGLLSERLNYYLALGYSRNSSMGRSGIELQYEALLKGQDTAYEVAYNSEGLALFEEAIVGQKGQNLKLSIDSSLQREVETIISNVFTSEANNVNRKYMNTIYVVVSDPSTGDILSMAGMKKDEDIIYNNPVSTYTESLAAGSSIKGATMYLGLSEGLVKFNEVIVDEPIKIADTPIKKSLNNLGRVNDLTALAKSSNVYMFHIAMRLGGANYVYNGPLNIDASAFDTIRNTFSQFGLGTLTGIDVPNETLGYIGTSTLGGHLLDFVIGQFDTYTTMQLSQYINTIANDGVRVKPRLLLEATQTDSEITTYQNPISVLSVLEDIPAIQRVQQGFRLCVTDGYCSSLNSLPVTVAAKTGTAESFMTDEEGNYFDSPNSMLVSYAPYENPEISIACAIPHAWNTTSQSNLCLKISNEIYAYYFDSNKN